jgi:hypothetical protein
MRKPAKRPHAKLGLNRDTVRVLGTIELVGARGGDEAVAQYDTGGEVCPAVKH